jgi:FkbM family methyltransferase
MLSFLKKISPNFLKNIARKTRSKIYSICDIFEPYLTRRNYFGYTLFYTKGTGIIERIRFGNLNRVYEPDLVESITTELLKYDSPVFLDIGTNIGLISLPILKKVPEVKIFGFEPGPTAYKSFATTIFANKLQDKIHLFNEALYKEVTTLSFYAHSDRDCGGDGIIDTKRAESLSTEIKVKTNTLDNWSKENNIPKIDVLKIDIEGAELYAFQGSIDFLKKYKPIIFLEISIENLKVYPYKEIDILNFFKSNNYELFDSKNKKCTIENISNLVTLNDTFIAKPKK